MFELAREHAIRSIAFPAIGCGGFGYPRKQAARIAVRECRDALAELDHPERVTLVAFDDEMHSILDAACADPDDPAAPP